MSSAQAIGFPPIRGTFFTGTRGVMRVMGVACVDEDCVWAFVLQASVRCGSGKENERCRRHLRNVQMHYLPDSLRGSSDKIGIYRED